MSSTVNEIVEVRAPATVANLGAGFDILGMALAEPADTVIAERTDTPGVIIAAIEGDGGRLSRDSTQNTAGIAAAHVLKQIGARGGVRLTIRKGLPLASGLGSSAASAVAGAVATNAVLGSPMKRIDLLAACVEGEAAVSGRHADNVAPALLGGIVLVTGTTPDAIYPLPVPPNLILALVTPNVAVPTAQARAVLPKQVSLYDMVHQTGAVARLIAALYAGDLPMLARAMESDRIVEPARAHLMPGLAEARAAAAKAGALATVISGAGPTLCAVCDSESAAARTAQAFRAVYLKLNLACAVRVTRPASDGATVKNVQ
ncbi:MAG: homoserine kinase [Aggregatilineales bacterium]